MDDSGQGPAEARFDLNGVLGGGSVELMNITAGFDRFNKILSKLRILMQGAMFNLCLLNSVDGLFSFAPSYVPGWISFGTDRALDLERVVLAP
eukprot:1445275-Amphidinium_carterae.1